MKYTLHTLTSRFLGILWLVTSVCMFVSCSDDTDETGGNFKLYYPDMTDIGPSMTGVKIPAPSFQGATPSEFEITAVTLNDESIENPCFIIDAETGEITINSTAETPVGEYKLTISCSVNGKYFTFKDIIKVTFLPRAPEGTVAEPNHILVMYSVVSDPNNITKLPTAQVKTAGEHVSITKYSIGTVTVNGEVLDKPEEMFEVSSSGEISILKSERFERGVTYSISLKLETAATGDTPCIATDILAVEIASEPFSLEYPGYNVEEGWKISEEKDGLKSSFDSSEPIFIGSQDDIKYWIEIKEEVEEGKIIIDETTGVISIPEGHGFTRGTTFNISVFVANKYLPEGKKLTDIKLTVTKYYKPLDKNFIFYNNIDIQQAEAININPTEWAQAGYEDLKIELFDEWKPFLTLNEDYTITAPEGNKLSEGKHIVKFRVINGDNTTEEYFFEINITRNTTKLLWIKCGNNLGDNGTALIGEEFENQFRYDTTEELKTFSAKLTSNLEDVTYTLIQKNVLFNYTGNGFKCKIEDGYIKFDALNTGIKDGVYVALVQGKKDGQTLITPIFIHYNSIKEFKDKEGASIGNYRVECTPFAFRVNPEFGGTLNINPKMYKIIDGRKEEIKNFYMDYRAAFDYDNLNPSADKNKWIKGKHKKGADGTTFITDVWSSVGFPKSETKSPLSQYTTDTNKASLGYVLNDNSVVIKPNVWKNENGYPQGFMRADMIFDLGDYPDHIPTFPEKLDGNRLSPFIIWFDHP